MEGSLKELPPSKRFKLLHNMHTNSQCLPAKKRFDSFHHQFSSSPAATAPPICLPAKKRVWAPHPLYPIEHLSLDLEREEDLESPKKQMVPAPEESVLLEEEEEADDGVVCAVCRSTDGDPLDPIVFCDGCDLMVHASCYGNPLNKSIPEGDWFCSSCEPKGEAKKKVVNNHCCLCPVEGGALKKTTDRRWAHIVCALLVPEVFFRDPEGREGIDCSQIPQRRWDKCCYLCTKSRGCAIECSEPRCRLVFHVSCAMEEGLCIEYKQGRAGTVVAGFCSDHSELWEKQQLSGKFKIVARKDDQKEKKIP